MQDLSSIFLLQADPKDDLWELYHANTKLSPQLMPPVQDGSDPVAELNAAIRKTTIEEMEAAIGSGGKRYPTAPSIKLPDELHPQIQQSFGKTMAERASRRSFASSQLSIEEISTLCRLAGGMNHNRLRPVDSPVSFRYIPSAGALYPLELYLMALAPLQQGESASPAGIWHYEPISHVLEFVYQCNPQRIAECFQTWPAEPPPLVALFTGIPKRQSWKYGARAYRYTLIEAGHAAQNLTLAATALGLRSCPIVGFYDDALHNLLDVDGVSEIALYSVFLGHSETNTSNLTL